MRFLLTGNIFFAERATFSADGNTGYIAGDINGDQSFPFQQKYCYLYALNLGADNVPINQPPQVSITSPASGFQTAKNTPVDVTANVQDDGEIAKVDFYYNSRGTTHFISTDTTPPFAATFRADQPDTYGIYAIATDTGGLTSQSAVVGIALTNRSPVVSWLSPSSGSQFVSPASIVLKVAASDPDGLITRVEFNSNLIGLIGQDATADADGSYSITFQNPGEGTHDLYAWAVDDNGYRQSAAITIRVVPPPGPSPISEKPLRRPPGKSPLQKQRNTSPAGQMGISGGVSQVFVIKSRTSNAGEHRRTRRQKKTRRARLPAVQ